MAKGHCVSLPEALNIRVQNQELVSKTIATGQRRFVNDLEDQHHQYIIILKIVVMMLIQQFQMILKIKMLHLRLSQSKPAL